MVYRPSWVIWCQTIPSTLTVGVLFNLLRGLIREFISFSRELVWKEKLIIQREFKLAYLDVTVQHDRYCEDFLFVCFQEFIYNYIVSGIPRIDNLTGDISTLEGTPLKLVDKFTYLGSSVESTEKDIETRLTKAWTAINRLSIIWKSDLTDKMKRSFFQAAVTSILLYGCTTWTLTKRLEKKLDGNYTRMLRAILNKSWQQHPTRHQLYGHLSPITKTIQVRRTRHAGHCWRSRDELIRDVLLWIPTHGRAKAGRPARRYIQQLCEDTGCCPEDLPRAMNDREEWRERFRDIRATSAIWWWYSIRNSENW